jgi:hypothetical protein
MLAELSLLRHLLYHRARCVRVPASNSAEENDMQMARHLFASGAVGLLLSTSAYPHDDAHWIEQNPSYISEDGKHCCGPGDCMRFGKDYFRQDDDAIYFLPTMQKFRLNGPGVHQSQTEDWWACLPGVGARGLPIPPPSAICIFVPFHTQ